MPATAPKAKQKSEAHILADATDRLLLAIKEKMLRAEGKVDYDKLAKAGYSAAMIERLKVM